MTDQVAGILLLRHDGALLLQHRDDKPGLRYAGMWVPPGGHADPDESLLDCARREFREETEYGAQNPQYLMSFDDCVKGQPGYRLTFFWDRYDGTHSIACREGQALAFIERLCAGNYPMPAFVLYAWDTALAAAGLTTGK